MNQVAPRSRGEAKVLPPGIASPVVKSSVSLTKVECAVRNSVCAMLSVAAAQWFERICRVTRSIGMAVLLRVRVAAGQDQIPIRVHPASIAAGNAGRAVALGHDRRSLEGL